MDCVKAIQDYITKMIIDATGMKVLLVDSETVQTVSAAFLKSQILQKEVYQTELIDAKRTSREVMTHVKAIVFVRPVQKSIDGICAELKKPRFGQYDIYFSNALDQKYLEQLAVADEHGVVREIQEFYADYLPIGKHLVSINAPAPHTMAEDDEVFQRLIDGIKATLLSLKKKPTIRYQKCSYEAGGIAKSVASAIGRDTQRFEFTETLPSTLLILDRKDDPFTPLLNQWTYEANLHERFGINKYAVEIPKDGKKAKFAIAEAHDDFFARNMYMSPDELCQSVQTLLATFQDKQNKKSLATVQEMKDFIASYPEIRAMSATVSKHITITEVLDKNGHDNDLYTCSELEQFLIKPVTQHFEVLEHISEQIKSTKTSMYEKTRVVMLYALRFGNTKDNQLDKFIIDLIRGGADPDVDSKIQALMQYAGPSTKGRVTDHFITSIMQESTTGKVMSLVTLGLANVVVDSVAALGHLFNAAGNVLMSHTPILQATLVSLTDGTLDKTLYPTITSTASSAKSQDIFIYMVGGCTYAESRVVHKFNETHPNLRVVLIGPTILNSKSFIDHVVAAYEKEE